MTPGTIDASGTPTDRHPALALWLIDLAAGAGVLRDIADAHGLLPPAMPASPPTASIATSPRDVARAALRIILAGYVGIDAAARPFVLAPGGKPALDHRSRPLSVDFSLAHCDSAAIVAVSREGPVGVDIEGPRSVRIAAHRRTLLLDAASSLAPDQSLPDGPGEARFLQAWVRLEALAKLTGEGLGALLGRLDDDAPPIAGTMVNGSKAQIRDVPVPTGPPLYAAIAGIGPSLAARDTPAPTWLPIERSWLEQWLAGGMDCPPERTLPPPSG